MRAVSRASHSVRRTARVRLLRAGAVRRVRSFRRRSAGAGKVSRGSTDLGIKRAAHELHRSRSGSANISDINSFFSSPTPCSPVMEPPASMHSQGCLSAASLRLFLPCDRGGRRGPADAGCRRRHETRWHADSRLRAEPLDFAHDSRQRGARDHAVLHDVVGRNASHGGEGGFASLPDQARSASDCATRISHGAALRGRFRPPGASARRLPPPGRRVRPAAARRNRDNWRAQRLRRPGSRGCPSFRSRRAACPRR